MVRLSSDFAPKETAKQSKGFVLLDVRLRAAERGRR